ncbi:hypothetical protein Lalb_Chr02g0150281 [Lupinus albus]|uniref:Uncharacterized protein n=1 Tax=Lupinus albus TaxID=3870 RepID=A0A6A4R161_LUPAL|nr:hypothetical protein Lalb_Chr02g0150281 [Lupinus albus]
MSRSRVLGVLANGVVSSVKCPPMSRSRALVSLASVLANSVRFAASMWLCPWCFCIDIES